MFQKRSWIVVALILALSLCIYGCGDNSTEESPQEQETAEETNSAEEETASEEAAEDSAQEENADVPVSTEELKDLLVSPYKDIDLGQYLELPDYDSFEITHVNPVKVTDEDVDKKIDEVLLENGTKENVTEGTVEDGDKINISFKGKLADGTPVDGISSDSFVLTLGAVDMVDGFQEGIVGHKVGETFQLELTFPKVYDSMPELAGKDTIFDITINNKIVTTPAELTDEFVQSVSDCKTVDEYKKQVRADMEADNAAQAVEEEKNSLFSKIVEETHMKEIYGERVDEYKDASLARYEKVAKDYELDWEDFVKQVFGLEVDEFDIEIVQYASEMVKQEMIIYSIAEKEGIEITEDELDDFIMQQLNNSGYKDRADFEAQSGMSIEEYIKNNNLVLNVYLNKELGIIYDRLTGR